MDDDMLYLGVKGSVVALQKSSGAELWRTHLKGGSFVTLAVGEDAVFAHTAGHLFCVDKANGAVRWSNDLPGLGYGLGTIALTGVAGGAEAMAQQVAAAAAAAAAASAANAANMSASS